MKKYITLLFFLFSLINAYSQKASINMTLIKNKFFDSEKTSFYLVQNSCKNDVKFEILNHLDSIPCRTDSIFKTNDNTIFIFNTFDQEGNLRYEGFLHLHIYDYSLLKSPSFNLITSSAYLDSLNIESIHYIDNNGREIHSICCCDWSLQFFENPQSEIDETIFDSEMIKRMAW